MDADIVVFDPERPSSLYPHELYAKFGWTVYEGWTFAGRVELTVLRGAVAYDRRAGDTPVRPASWRMADRRTVH